MAEHKNYRAARRMKRALRKKLGNCCWGCGSKTRRLEFDVIVPVHPPDGHSRKLSWDQRMRYYMKHEEAGNLRLSCRTCNGKKGSTEDKDYHRRMREAAAPPF